MNRVAKWWKSLDGVRVACGLCPRGCVVSDGGVGFCGIRGNEGGRMVSFAYGRPVALQVDPIEKKPLNEFLPGTRTFSLGTFGCNLDCVFCQNHHLSRGRYSSSDTASEPPFPPEKIAELAVEKGCGSVAFTYNEPLVWGEYVVDCAAAARMRGLKTVLVSNAYVELSAARDIFPLIDAANFDVKGFGSFYDGMTGGKLRSVLDAVEFYHSLGGHLEITNLVVPGRNDGDKEVRALLDWASSELGLDVPLHFSAFHPAHRFHFAPPTPKETLFRIRDMALERGFESVYLGNVVV